MRNLSSLFVTTLIAAGIITSVSAAEPPPLEGRLPATPGGTEYQAYYDPNLDVTWMANANAAGLRDWAGAKAWAESLKINGIGGWRLPSADVNGDKTVAFCSGGITGCADNEMDFLFSVEGITATNPGPFSNIQSSSVAGAAVPTAYWSNTTYDSSPDYAWVSSFVATVTFVWDKSQAAAFAWAVYPGDVADAPEPGISAINATNGLLLLDDESSP